MRSKSLPVQVIVTDAHVAVKKYGDPLTEAGLQIGVPIDVDHFDFQRMCLAHLLERKNHLVTEMAVGSTVDRQANGF